MCNNTIWLKQLFSTFTAGSQKKIYFEDKSKLGTSNLNISVHPIRFADDIFLNFETNDMSLRAKLKKYEVNYDIFFNHADLIKASFLKTNKKNTIKKNSILIVGQMEKDKALFDGLRYHSFLDYIEDIKTICSNYDHVYYKPHPYSKKKQEYTR